MYFHKSDHISLEFPHVVTTFQIHQSYHFSDLMAKTPKITNPYSEAHDIRDYRLCPVIIYP